MAIAKFHSFRGEKSALILVKANAFQMSASPAYVPADAVRAVLGDEPEEGADFEIPDGFKLSPMVDSETGEVRTTKDGQTLHTLVW